MPFDGIADIIPGIGFLDDVIAIGAAYTMANMYVNDEARRKAQEQMRALFGDDILKEKELALAIEAETSK
ncbi:MAG: DUF1232 domain-containing protein [Synergistaceae bacterium]|nr:DUF1232 domain-containing protein [Synergistaceae bacterium]MBQ9897462.1 DUF1232 domain-containing protein [Synergistaceae bacterium]MBR0221980.1 DUF1232 domain-containing protein [Synergistaceae bacterium]